MSNEPVVDWDATFKKGVRTQDGQDAGIVVGVSSGYVIVQKGVTRELLIPKHKVEGFDGNELTLSIPKQDLKKYEMKI
jgi:hypothetical protein